MNSTVYIQAEKNYPYNFDLASAYLALKQNKTPTKLFNHIDEVPVERSSVVFGSIQNTHQFFLNMGWEIPTPIHIPDELNNNWWTNRKIEKTTLDEALQKGDFPFFMKPIQLKLFNGEVLEKPSHRDFYAEYPKETEVLISGYINFVSEYRCYVLENELVACCHYAGSMDHYPDIHVVKDMIRQFKNGPKFYSLDVGIVLGIGGRVSFTFLVECNDGYSLGNYGLTPSIYTRGLLIRWREILGKSPLKSY
jgi:hypothetical protein